MSGLRITEGPGPLEYTQKIRELITNLQMRFDPSLTLMPNLRRRCWMIVQDLRRVRPPLPPGSVYRQDIALIGGKPSDFDYFDLSSKIPYKHLFDFTLNGQAFMPSYEYIMLAVDDSNPRGDDPELMRKLAKAQELYEKRVATEDEEDTAYLRNEFDKYLELEGVAVGRGLKHFTFGK